MEPFDSVCRIYYRCIFYHLYNIPYYNPYLRRSVNDVAIFYAVKSSFHVSLHIYYHTHYRDELDHFDGLAPYLQEHSSIQSLVTYLADIYSLHAPFHQAAYFSLACPHRALPLALPRGATYLIRVQLALEFSKAQLTCFVTVVRGDSTSGLSQKQREYLILNPLTHRTHALLPYRGYPNGNQPKILTE